MREIRLSGSEGGGNELNRTSLPLSAGGNGAIALPAAKHRTQKACPSGLETTILFISPRAAGSPARLHFPGS